MSKYPRWAEPFYVPYTKKKKSQVQKLDTSRQPLLQLWDLFNRSQLRLGNQFRSRQELVLITFSDPTFLTAEANFTWWIDHLARYWCVWTKFKNNSKIKSKKREEKRGASESSPLLYIRWKHGKSNENSVFPLIPMWNRNKIVIKLIFSPNTRLDPGILN